MSFKNRCIKALLQKLTPTPHHPNQTLTHTSKSKPHTNKVCPSISSTQNCRFSFCVCFSLASKALLVLNSSSNESVISCMSLDKSEYPSLSSSCCCLRATAVRISSVAWWLQWPRSSSTSSSSTSMPFISCSSRLAVALNSDVSGVQTRSLSGALASDSASAFDSAILLFIPDVSEASDQEEECSMDPPSSLTMAVMMLFETDGCLSAVHSEHVAVFSKRETAKPRRTPSHQIWISFLETQPFSGCFTEEGVSRLLLL
ncbi:hypothetical protein EYF80_025337 [Liparis tanakae]|uniref:Uncharacterized protein n=1 Tax=Liparis tanakae TaxID=230148 RepID=A0A4Z2HFJ6_9TELE|nr:hypothetical protein EYF80_025337 [Liparis tanakae]